MKVAMLVLNDCVNDSRVLKQAKTLSEFNHEVRIIAVTSKAAAQGVEHLNSGKSHIFRVNLSTVYIGFRNLIDRVFSFRLLSRSYFFIRQLFSTLIKVAVSPLYFAYRIVANIFESGTKSHIENNCDSNRNRILYFTYRLYRKAYSIVRKVFFLTKRYVKKIIILSKRFVKSIVRRIKLLVIRFGVLVLVPLNKISLVYSYQQKSLQVLEQWKPDVVHAHDLNTLGAAFKYYKKHSTPYVYDSHELWTHRNQPLGKNKLVGYIEKYSERKFIRHSFANITVSNNISRWLSTEYKIPEPIVLRNIPSKFNRKSGQVANNHSIKSQAGMNETDSAILFTGRVSQGRGLETVIKSLKQLDEQVHFCLLGYGNQSYVDELIQLTENQGCQHRVHFLGAVAPEQVTLAASTADVAIVFIEPVCLSYKYCMPNKLFESIQARLPVLINDLPDMRELVEKYEVGLVANEENLAEKVQSLLNNKSDYKQNLEIAAEQLNWEIESQKLISLYERVELNLTH